MSTPAITDFRVFDGKVIDFEQWWRQTQSPFTTGFTDHKPGTSTEQRGFDIGDPGTRVT